MIILIGGPTASGKSEVALELCKLLNGEIINGDAFQIYRHMDIGTAKPSLKEREEVKHHLFDIRNPDETYNIKDYQKDARNVIDDILKRGKLPIIVGGTGLYQLSLLYDYDFKDEDEINLDDLAQLNNHELHQYLKSIDPKSSEKIHENNRKRVLRAIAIYRSTGETKSSLIDKQSHSLIYDDVIMVGIDCNRDVLYERINSRVDDMVENGLFQEVEALIKKYGTNQRAFDAIGYKESISYLTKQCSKEEAILEIKKHTRNYAKRQVTFFKNKFEMNWFPSKEDIKSYILERIEHGK